MYACLVVGRLQANVQPFRFDSIIFGKVRGLKHLFFRSSRGSTSHNGFSMFWVPRHSTVSAQNKGFWATSPAAYKWAEEGKHFEPSLLLTLIRRGNIYGLELLSKKLEIQALFFVAGPPEREPGSAL